MSENKNRLSGQPADAQRPGAKPPAAESLRIFWRGSMWTKSVSRPIWSRTSYPIWKAAPLL